MRYLSIIILALVANIASAQQVNPVTDYTFANRMSSGRSTVTDTAAYFSIGPRYGAVRGMMPPMVTDTVSMSANKRNGLLIFSIQKNKYQVWDSAGAKWADITGAAGSAIISADTTAMLLPYLRKADTTAMLSPYLKESDTVWLSNRINLKLNISDTSSMLTPYLRKVDTTAMLSPYARISNVNASLALKINISDTATMLSPYLKESDTTFLSNRINLKVNIADTATMLSPYLKESDTTFLSNRINLKLNISDTSSMLNPYLRGYGTANYFPKFDASRSVINSKLYESGTNLLFNTTNPSFTSAGITTIENNATSSAVYTYKIADTIRAYMGYGGSSTFDINNLRAGDIRFYTNAQLRGRFQTDGTFRLNSLTGTGSRIVTADADGVLSATSSATGLVDTLVLSTRAWRQKGIDSVSANVALKVNISDTSSMLTNYIRHAGNGLTKSGQALSVDTAAIATRARVQKGIDSVATLASAGVTSVATGYGLSGGTITTTGTITVDSAIVASRLRVGKVVDSLALVKQNVLTNPVTGTGTTNYVPKFTGTSTIGNSQIFDNGSSVGVGTSSPNAYFEFFKSGSASVLANTNDNSSAAYFSVLNSNASAGNFMQYRAYGNNTNETLFGASTNKMNAIWSNADARFAIGTIGATPLIFGNSNTEGMRLSNNELIIGTTNDAGNFKLQILGGAYLNGKTESYGSANSFPGIRIINVDGSPGTQQDYLEFGTISTTIARMFRGNAASGVSPNGLNIDNFEGFQIRVNQLGSSGGSINLLGGEVLVNTTTDAGDYKLQVSGNAYVTGTTVSQNVVASAASGPGFTSLLTTTDGQRIRMIMDGTNGVIEATRLSGTQPNMIFRTEGVEAMRLNPTRELILASDGADAGDYKLQVVGNLYNTANAALSATSGTVSIGNTSFGTYKLNVSGTGNFAQSAGGGSATATALLLTNTSDATTNGVRLSFQQSGATYETSYITALRVGTQSYTSLVFATGESGWNTAAPTEKIRMHYNGGLKFFPQSAAPTAEAGTVYYDTDDNKLKVYNGTTWVDLH